MIGNLKSNVGNENANLLTEMESDDEGIIHTICIKFVKLNFYVLIFFFNTGELLIDGATSVSNSRLEDEDY